jgi:hypothetical protein
VTFGLPKDERAAIRTCSNCSRTSHIRPPDVGRRDGQLQSAVATQRIRNPLTRQNVDVYWLKSTSEPVVSPQFLEGIERYS